MLFSSSLNIKSLFLRFFVGCGFVLASVGAGFGQIKGKVETDSLERAMADAAARAFSTADSLLKRKDPFGASVAFRESLGLYRKVYGSEHPGLPNIYRTAAELFATHEQMGQAAHYLQEGLKILHAQARLDYGEIGRFNLYLGKVYKEEGYHMSAIDYYKDAIAAYERDSYETHFEQYAISKILIGKAYYEMGDFDAAIDYFTEVKDFLEKYSGPVSNDMATMYNNIGASYLGKHDPDSALENLKKSVDISETVNGVNSRHTAEKYGMMSVAYFNSGQYDSSFVFAERVIEVYKGLPGNFLKEVADYQRYLGQRFIDLRAYNTAEIWFDKFLETRHSIETDSMAVLPDSLIAYEYTDHYRKISKSFSENYQYAYALKYLDKGFAFMSEREEPSADSLALVLARDAKELSIKMANWEKAEDYAERLLEASMGSKSMISSDSLRKLYEELGNIRMNANQYKSALYAYRQAGEHIAAFNNKMSVLYNRMGRAYYMLNEYDSARRLLEVSVNFYQQVYGGKHLLLPEACLVLGVVYYYRGEHAKSFNTLRVVIKAAPSLLEKKDKIAVEANRVLGNLYREKGKEEEAEQYVEQANRLARQVYKGWQMNE